MSNDMVTELGAKPSDATLDDYNDFLTNIEDLKLLGYPLESGTVTQPNNVRALCTGEW